MSLIIKTPVLENQKFNAEIQAQNTEKFNDVYNKIQAEISNRQSADTTLQNNLNTEISNRQNADTTLQNNLNTEISNRQNAVTTLQNNLNTEISNRQNADTTLQNSLDDEIEARQTDYNTLKSSLDNEIDNRLIADNTLTNNLNLEISNRQRAVSDTKLQLSTQISEVQAAQNLINEDFQTQINQLQNGSTSNFGELEDKIDALEAKHDSDCAIFRADLNSEISSRRSADSTLQTQINSNLQTLTNNLNAEIAARQASDTSLLNSLNTEIAARIAGDTNLQEQIDALRAEINDNPTILPAPSIDTATFIFDKSNHTISISNFDATLMTKSGIETASDVGVYSITFTILNSNYIFETNSSTITLTWRITPKTLLIPILGTNSFTYTGKTISPNLSYYVENSTDYTGSGDFSAINVGNYIITLSLNDKNNTTWNDGSTSDKIFNWQITRATLPAPSIDTATFTFDNSNHTVTISNFDANLMTKTGTETASDIGVYQVTCNLSNSNYIFDNNSATVTLPWEISKIKLPVPEIGGVTANVADFAWSIRTKRYSGDMSLVDHKVTLNGSDDVSPFTTNATWLLPLTNKIFAAGISFRAGDSDAVNLLFNSNHTPKANVFQLVFSLNDTSTCCWEDDSITDKVFPLTLPAYVIPEVFNDATQDTALTFTGQGQKWSDAFLALHNSQATQRTLASLTDSTFDYSYTNAGTYSGSLTPRLFATWSDGSYAAKSYTFTIDKANLTFTAKCVETGASFDIEAKVSSGDKKMDFTFYPGFKSLSFQLSTAAALSNFEWYATSYNYDVSNHSTQYFTFDFSTPTEKSTTVTVTPIKSWKGKNSSYAYSDNTCFCFSLAVSNDDDNNFETDGYFIVRFLNLLTLEDFTWEMIVEEAISGAFSPTSGIVTATGELKNYFELGCTKTFSVSGTWGNLLDFGTSTTLTAVFIGANHNCTFEGTTGGATFAVVKSVSSDGLTWYPIVPDDYGENYVVDTQTGAPFYFAVWSPNYSEKDAFCSVIDDTSLQNAIVQLQKYFSTNPNQKANMKIFALSWYERFGDSNTDNLPSDKTPDFSNQQQYDYFANGNNPILARVYNGTTYTDTVVYARQSGDRIYSFPVSVLSLYAKLGVIPCFCVA